MFLKSFHFDNIAIFVREHAMQSDLKNILLLLLLKSFLSFIDETC